MNHAHPHHHDHSHSLHSNSNALLWPFLLTLAFAIIETFGGWFTGSLALLGDAGHMFSDSAALALASLGAWIARRPPSAKHSYGLMRAEVMVALLNGVLMLFVVGFIVVEAIARLAHPQPVLGGEVMLIALLGLLINLLVAWRLGQNQHSLNNRAALLHVLGDVLGSVAALAAGAVIYFSGWLAIDPLLSIFISLLILASTLNLLREVLHVLMEGVPPGLEIAAVKQAMTAHPQVVEVHSVHIWALSSEITALSAHVALDDLQYWHGVLADLREMLHTRFDIDHVTLQPESVAALKNGEVACWLTQKDG
ncbi:MAG: cation transporter [Methylophilaceae bacterium]|nr:cation transporter [Methylophilaceae bacterium]